MTATRRQLFRAALLGALLCLLVWLVRMTDARALLRSALVWIEQLGPLAPLVFILTYVVACLTFFPGFILTLGAGIIFGPFWGTVYVCVGATLGACSAFLIARHLARARVARKFSKNRNFQAIDQAVARDGWKIVGLIRLSPVFPFIPMNFAFGLTRIPFAQFAAATGIGILPLTAMFVYLGSLIGDIAHLGNRPIASGQAQWIVSAVGIATTIVVTGLVTRLAKKALEQTLPERGGD